MGEAPRPRAAKWWVGAGSGVLVAGGGAAAAAANFVALPVAVGLGAAAAGAAGWAAVLAERRRTARELTDDWLSVAGAGPAGAPQPQASLLAWLNPDGEVVPFAHRRVADLRELLTWCRGEETAVWTVTGGAGEGKTRLLVELCSRLVDDGWAAGWVHRGQEPAVVGVAGRWDRPVLVVVDDADTRDDVAVLLADVLRRRDLRVRVVLAAREFGDWWTRTRAGLPPELARELAPASRSVLGQLAATGPEQRQRFAAALKAFADDRGVAVPQAGLAGAPAATPLVVVHAAAAIAVDQSLSGPVDLDSALELLFATEESWWRDQAARHGLNVLRPEVLPRAVVAAVLLGARDAEAAERLLGHLPGLTGQDDRQVRDELAVWLHGLYPQKAGQWLWPHLPARLAERYVADRLAADPPLVVAVAAAAGAVQ